MHSQQKTGNPIKQKIINTNHFRWKQDCKHIQQIGSLFQNTSKPILQVELLPRGDLDTITITLKKPKGDEYSKVSENIGKNLFRQQNRMVLVRMILQEDFISTEANPDSFTQRKRQQNQQGPSFQDKYVYITQSIPHSAIFTTKCTVTDELPSSLWARFTLSQVRVLNPEVLRIPECHKSRNSRIGSCLFHSKNLLREVFLPAMNKNASSTQYISALSSLLLIHDA